MATLYKTDGTQRVIETLRSFTLEEVQALIGGYVEAYPHAKGYILCDEEGLLKGKPVNPYFPQLVGDVLCVTRKEFK